MSWKRQYVGLAKLFTCLFVLRNRPLCAKFAIVFVDVCAMVCSKLTK